MIESSLTFKGISTHNLKHIDVAIPHYQITAVTGISGSGKSSLVFDTIYAESYRRYLDSLSGFTKQHMQVMNTAHFDEAEHLPAAVAIKQVRPSSHPRSQVGTVTEVYDLLRNLFPYVAELRCCGELVREDHPESITVDLEKRFSGAQHFLILAPLQHYQISATELREYLLGQGFGRILRGDEVLRLEAAKDLDRETDLCVVDRIAMQNSATKHRLLEALRLGLRLGHGKVMIKTEDGHLAHYSSRLECNVCGTVYRRLSPVIFSKDHPLGACPDCQGFGAKPNWDRHKMIRDMTSSLAVEGVDFFNFGTREHVYGPAKISAKKRKMPFDKAFKSYTKADWDWFYAGEGDFCGVEGFITWLESKRYKPHYRMHLAKFRSYTPCSTCEQTGLGLEARRAEAVGVRFADLINYSILQFSEWVQAVQVPQGIAEREHQQLSEILDELRMRCSYLLRIGVGYLALSRRTRTLSGGEFQRINMARTLANELTESLVCLDEPSCGLHPVDSEHLKEMIFSIKKQGNTVLLVEHSRELIEACDRVIEIGPGAGEFGGDVTYSGPVKNYKFQELRIKAAAPHGRESYFGLQGVRTHNLKNIDVRFLFAHINSVCGVSGSGKSSLVASTLYPAVYQVIHGKSVEGNLGLEAEFVSLSNLDLIKMFHDVVLVSQKGIGRSSRSTIGTYLGIFNQARKLFANTEMARRQKLTAKDFSFNVAGGRCETCLGLGYVVEDLSFLGEVKVVCPDCDGQRFQERILSVLYQGKSYAELLNMSIVEALDFFSAPADVRKTLNLVNDLGLGYLRLGQTTDSFSGGEAQRLKLLDILSAVGTQKPYLILFDEPSAGLSDRDLALLFKTFQKLTEQGHTIITVEHHMAMCAASNWLVEIGPGASHLGGDCVFQGPPEGILDCSQSQTRPYIQAAIKQAAELG